MEEQAVREILERTTRIETKLDNYESVRDKADKAYSLALNNAKDIAKIESNNKWAWGYMIGLGIALIGSVAGLLISKL
ncbi:hemolysin XhlA family protein [Lactococcus formosensis]|uniref:hemolysin XhlA family protein n=1 Tax=Lactococcus formosensis TaxID=1281486 RepID=UPI002435B487|nr:hemolysin XhlA family protein [Lactococcus formosensis]MDG6115439.1 hemolysin XhlA family protein [Lactococcus formosensis]MDT2725929.1 hemolysin XhlA family protein [Lactococcus formosensis]